MSRELSLLERLAEGRPKDTERSLRIDHAKCTRSVLEHLREMFNVRHGNAPATPRYGLPDISDLLFEFPDAARELRSAIQETIRLHEPRLRDVRVRHTAVDDDPLNQRFEISARMQLEDEEEIDVHFHTVVGDSGEVDVS